MPATSKSGNGNKASKNTKKALLLILLFNLSNMPFIFGDISFAEFPRKYPTNSPRVEPNAAIKATASGLSTSAKLAAIIKLGEGSNTVAFAKKQIKNSPK